MLNMKQLIVTVVLCLLSIGAKAQNQQEPFRAYLYNNEYEVYLKIDFYNESVTVPGQELYGEIPGYLGKKNNSFCWIITSADIKDNTAKLAMINDFGSEDLTATLTVKNDTLYVLKQIDGSTLKVPKNGKWQKLPSSLPFTLRKTQR